MKSILNSWKCFQHKGPQLQWAFIPVSDKLPLEVWKKKLKNAVNNVSSRIYCPLGMLYIVYSKAVLVKIFVGLIAAIVWTHSMAYIIHKFMPDNKNLDIIVTFEMLASMFNFQSSIFRKKCVDLGLECLMRMRNLWIIFQCVQYHCCTFSPHIYF